MPKEPKPIASLEEFLELSAKAKRTKQEERRIEAAKFYQKLAIELDRVMPELPGRMWYGGPQAYKCLICGSAVVDRVLHLRWHRGTDMVDVLTTLFGRPN